MRLSTRRSHWVRFCFCLLHGDSAPVVLSYQTLPQARVTGAPGTRRPVISSPVPCRQVPLGSPLGHPRASWAILAPQLWGRGSEVWSLAGLAPRSVGGRRIPAHPAGKGPATRFYRRLDDFLGVFLGVGFTFPLCSACVTFSLEASLSGSQAQDPRAELGQPLACPLSVFPSEVGCPRRALSLRGV